MAGPGVIYLDVDDEITSAAARIRRSEPVRVAVVLPHGSRVATSRINFRLLARDALTHEKRLSIVAPDGATRSMAASAGLPVFATVAEYEDSLEEEPPTDGPVGGAAAAPADATTRTTVEPSPAPGDGPARIRRNAAAAGSAGAAAADSTAAASTSAPGPTPERPVAAGPASTDIHGPTRRPRPRPEPETAVPQARSIPVVGVGRREIPRVPVMVGAAVLGLVVLVAAVGAYALLPSATVVVTPHERLIGPFAVSVVADTTATEPDPEARIVPAQRLTVEVTGADTFAATGRRVERTRAEGRVTFQSLDTSSANTIPQGSVVSTEGGIQFRTLRSITLARAAVVPPLSISPSSASVAVEAVRNGPDGNVPANSITVVPQGENPDITKVRNPDATSGGSEEEFPLVAQEDVDAALEALGQRLQAEFFDRLDDPSFAPAGATVFTETAMLGEATPDVDPAELVGLEQETFDLGLRASGTVIAVDPEPVETIAEARLGQAVSPGSTLVEGSVQILPGAPVIDGQEVSFPVSVRATEVSIPDAAELEALILGKPRAEAETLLAQYGDVELTLWPDWVASVPTIDGRVTVEVAPPVPAETPPPTPRPTSAPSPAPTDSAPPSASPSAVTGPSP